MHPVVEPPTLSILYSSTAIATGGLLEGRVRTTDGSLGGILRALRGMLWPTTCHLKHREFACPQRACYALKSI